jgi:hypothetical protein
MDVRGLEEAQPVVAQLDHIVLPNGPHSIEEADAEGAEVQNDRELAADQLGLGSAGHEGVHAAALVALEVEQDDVGQPSRVDHLCHRAARLLVGREKAGVDERGALVVDQELVEANRRVPGPEIR